MSLVDVEGSSKEQQVEYQESSDDKSISNEGDDSEDEISEESGDETHNCVFSNYLTRLSKRADISQILAKMEDEKNSQKLTPTQISSVHHNAMENAIVPPSFRPSLPNPVPPHSAQPFVPCLEQPQNKLQEEILVSLRDIQAKLDVFTTHTTPLPDSTNAASTQHVARQIIHWASLFDGMLNCSSTSTAVQDLPQTSSSQSLISSSQLQPPSIPQSSVQQHSIPESSVMPHSIPESSVMPHSILQSSVMPHSIPQSSVMPQSTLQSSDLPQSILQSSVQQQSILQSPILPQSIPQSSGLPQSILQSSILPQSIPQSSILPQSIPQSSILPQSIPQSTSSNPMSSSQPQLVPQLSIQPPTTKESYDRQTLDVFQQHNEGIANIKDWLSNLHIPRNVESLQEIKKIWEVGGRNCPPLRLWTPKMRRPGNGIRNHSSIFNQRKKLYIVLKECNFSEHEVQEKFGEVKPGKLYKALLDRGHCSS